MTPASIKSAPPPAPAGIRLGHLLNLSNMLTLCRVFSIPIFLAFLSKHRLSAALYVFCLAALTDALDGTVARWFDCKTEIGVYLDPFADKLLLLSAFVALTVYNAIPGWLLGVVIIRDVVIVFGYFSLAYFTNERVPVSPSYIGKAATFFQLACVIGALANLGARWPRQWYGLLYLTVAITALTGVHYAYRGLVWLRSHEPQLFE
jgi:cardiolipin synthase